MEPLHLDQVAPATLGWLALLFFAVALTGAFLIAPHNKLPGRGNAPLPMHLGGGPILQVELARNENDLRAVLMNGDVERNLRDARFGNNWDTRLFIPGYAGFLLVVGVWLARGGRRLRGFLLFVALLVVPVIAICDWAENYGISQALNHMETGAPQPGDARHISAPSTVKWSLLAVTLLCYAVAAFLQPEWWGWFVIAPLLLLVGLALARLMLVYAQQL
jgi:hypothetical protein